MGTKNGWAAVLLYGCVAILLVTATVEAAHLCGLESGQIAVSAQGGNGSSSATQVCTLCLLIHSATALLLFAATSAPLLKRPVSWPTFEARFVPTLTSFQLYVRPPPSR